MIDLSTEQVHPQDLSKRLWTSVHEGHERRAVKAGLAAKQRLALPTTKKAPTRFPRNLSPARRVWLTALGLHWRFGHKLLRNRVGFLSAVVICQAPSASGGPLSYLVSAFNRRVPTLQQPETVEKLETGVFAGTSLSEGQ